MLAGRTLQSLARLYFDLAPLLALDHRVRLHYCLTEGSSRRDLAERRAIAIGMPLTSWRRVRESRPDLVIAADASPVLYEAGAPVALLPHGATYNRVQEGATGAAGTDREHLIGPAGERPAFMAMPGRAGMEQLAADCPEAVGAAMITGDLCMERLRRSTGLRRAYRDALGVHPGRTLVVLSSTWGPYSLTGTHLTLVERLLSALPADEFALAYVPHPNIDADHGGNLVPYLRPSLGNGLIMVPPEDGWRALLIAADCVVGDHGSVTFYAANLGRPVLLGAFGSAENVPGTPQAAFGRDARRLDHDGAAAPQIRAALAAPGRGRTDYLRAAWSEPEPVPSQVIPRRIYELLGLEPAPSAAPPLLPPPDVIEQSRPMNAWHCRTRVNDDAITCERYPAARAWHASDRLAVDTACLDPELREGAHLLLHHQTSADADQVDAIAAELLADHRLCALVSVATGPGEATAVTDHGARYRIRAPKHVLDVVPAALGAALEAALPLGRLTLRLGDERFAVAVEPC